MVLLLNFNVDGTKRGKARVINDLNKIKDGVCRPNG